MNDSHWRALQKMPVWIAGAGKSALAAAQLCKRHNLDAFITDAGQISHDAKTTLLSLGFAFEEGGHSLGRLQAECGLLVLSPAILLTNRLVLAAKAAGILVVSEIEFASWFLTEDWSLCAITGTNGKSTTTHYLAQLLGRAGYNASACGNIGLPLAAVALAPPSPRPAAVIELSSYQLESIFTLKPFSSVVLNLQEDHQERYQSIDEYLKAKWRLVMLTQALVVIEEKTLLHALKLGLTLPQCPVFVVSQRPPLTPTSPFAAVFAAHAQGFSLPVSLYGSQKSTSVEQLAFPRTLAWAQYTRTATEITIELSENPHCPGSAPLRFSIAHPCLPGSHNVENLLAAAILALASGVDLELIQCQWETETTTYQHLPHRLERIPVAGSQFRFYNDSKATNIESLLVALKSFSTPVRLLVGGYSKGECYSPLAQFAHHPVVTFYPFGAVAQEVSAELLKSPLCCVAPPMVSMLDAANAALKDMVAGDTLLLSPGCSSFDEFKNFEHRGDCFREWVCAQKAEA